MSKLIELTFVSTPAITDTETLTLYANDGTTFLDFPLTFVSGTAGSLEVEIPSPYNENTQASNYDTVWTSEYEITDISDPKKSQFTVVSTVGNVVTLFTNNDYNWTAPDGDVITDGSVTFNIISTSSISLDAYSTVVGSECTQVDVTVSMSGGTSPYDIYVDDVLESSAVTSPHDARITRGLSREIKVLDNGGSLVGISDTVNTTSLTSDNISINATETASGFDVEIVADVISSEVSPYTYSDDDVTYQSSNVFTGVSSGSNTFYVKDALGCVTSKTIVLGYSLIYYLEFTDLEGILHRVNISKFNYAGASTEVNGRCFLEYPENDDLQSPIKASNLRITLEADSTLTFTDLYEEEERVFKVEYIRNSVTLFNGFLNPEGLFESYVTDRWLLELNAIDGLGYLKDLAYVDDLSGLKFTGKQKGIEIIANALKRTGIRQNIRTDISIRYNGLIFGDILDKTYYFTDRLVNNQEGEILDCETVLKAILKIYNASLVSYNGEWFIYRANQLFDNNVIAGYLYDSDGANQSFPANLDLSQSLGSKIDSYALHHANANQQKTIKRSLGAYRVSLDYGDLVPFYDNVDLNWTNTTTIPDWTINQSSFIEPVSNLRRFYITNSSNALAIATSDTYTIPSTGFVKEVPQLDFNFVISNPSEFNTATFKAIVTIDNAGGTDQRYLNQDNGVWNTLSSFIELELEPNTSNYNLRIISNSTPYLDARLNIELYNDTNDYIVESIKVTAFRGESEPIGKNYTITKTGNLTPNVDDSVEEVLFGDVPLNSFESAIFKQDETSQTSRWRREGKTESKPLLQIHVEDRLAMQFSPRLIFKGDVYGYLPFLCVLNINNINSKMLPYAYSYDCYNNVITLSSMQLLNQSINLANATYSETDVYKNVIKPTIK